MMVHLVSCLLLVAVACPSLVQSCSCVAGAFDISRPDAIRRDYCYSEDVYAGMVIGATCNCIPEAVAEGLSNRLNCLQYNLSATSAEVTTVARGQCQYERYSPSDLGQYGCAGVSSVLSGGLNLEVDSDMGGDELLNLTDTSSEFENCVFSCPFNVREGGDGGFAIFSFLPCLYTVRVAEVFRGNYSAGDVLEVAGPDVQTSCGAYGRRLSLGMTYVANLGQACSPISDWTELGDYSAQEMELLRSLQESERCGAVAQAVAMAASTSLLVLLLLATSFVG